MPGKNRPSRKAKLEIEGNITIGRKSEAEKLTIAETEKSIQICIADSENKANVWLPKSKITWVPNGIDMPIWLAARITKTDDLFQDDEQAGRDAVAKFSFVLPKTVSMRGHVNSAEHAVSKMVAR